MNLAPPFAYGVKMRQNDEHSESGYRSAHGHKSGILIEAFRKIRADASRNHDSTFRRVSHLCQAEDTPLGRWYTDAEGFLSSMEIMEIMEATKYSKRSFQNHVFHLAISISRRRMGRCLPWHLQAIWRDFTTGRLSIG
jgi:hypothetical protein